MDNISSLEDLAYQYQTATSAYQQWQDAMSGGEEGNMYDSIQGNMESIKDLYDKGLVGENKFREFVDLMSNKDLTNASVDEIVAAYEESYPKMERYFTEGQEGCQAFLQDISNLNSEWAHMNEDGSWDINFGVGNDQEIADALGIDVEAVQSVLRKLHDFGFDIDLDQPVKSLEQLKTEAQSAKEALDGMGETSLDSINLDTDSFSEITDDIDKVKEYIQQVNDADLEPEVRTERLEQANNILDYLVQKQHEAGQNNIVIDADASSVDQKISDLKSQLEQFRNNDGNLNNSIKAQEDTYNQLTKKLSDYQKEVDSQLSSGYLKKGSEAYQSAMKNIQDFTAKIYDASTSLLELRDKLDQIKIDTIQNVIDGIKRNSDITEKYISYLQSQNRDVPENLYTDRIDNNNAQVQQNLKQMEIYRKKQAVLDVNSKSYQDYAEKIQTLKENTLELITDNESLQDSIYELRFKPLDDAIQKYSDLEDELKSFRDLLNDDAFLDKQGRITEEGLAQVALLQQSIGTAKQKIADYTTGLQKLKESYDNGVISLTEYNDKSKDYREGIQGSIADVKSYQDSLVDLYKNAMSTEVQYLDKIISKQKNLLEQRKSAYEYEKKVTSQSNDINKLKAEIIALQGSNNLSDQSRLRKLQADLKSAESDLQDTKRDHAYDMQSQGFDKLSSDLQETLDNTEYEISHNADKQLEIINSMLDKAVSSYQEAYGKINSIIKNTGWVGSTDFNNTQSDLSTETGVKNQNSNASQSQSSANKNPSSTASGTKTDPINSNSKANSDLADQLVKPEDTTNRKVAELKVSPTSTTLEEGKSTSITATIRPNDAANKTLAFIIAYTDVGNLSALLWITAPVSTSRS